MKKIVIANQKGGVGKTTTSDYVGDCTSIMGAKVLKVDADFQMNLSIRHGISNDKANQVPVLIDLIHGNGSIEESIIPFSEGVDILPSRFENATIDSALTEKNLDLSTLFHKIFAPIEKNYDLIIIDCPAMLGKLVTAISLYVDMVVCPLNPEEYSIQGLETLKTELRNIEHNYGRAVEHKTYLNKFENNTILSNATVSTTITTEINQGHGYDVVVRSSQEIANALAERKTLFNYVKKSGVRDDFLNLTKKIVDFDKLLQQTETS